MLDLTDKIGLDYGYCTGTKYPFGKWVEKVEREKAHKTWKKKDLQSKSLEV